LAIGYIYLITNTLNGKKYVGQTSVSITQRWRQHRSASKKESTHPLYRAIKKYGPDRFTVECLEVVAGSRAELVTAEIRLIAAHGCITPNGYNLSKGGEGYDSSQPRIRANHDAAVRKSSTTASWRSAQFEGAKKRLADPEWVANNRDQLKRMHNSPEWKEKNSGTLRALHQDPRFQQKLADGITRRSSNSGWRSSNALGLSKSRLIQAAKVLERDSLRTPEEVLRRVRQREATKGWKSKQVKSEVT
jgi:group I intron endonuclease